MLHIVIIAIAIVLEIATLFLAGLDSALLPLWELRCVHCPRNSMFVQGIR